MLLAVENNLHDIVVFLVENGANINLKSIHGTTPYIMASYDKSRKKIDKYLEKKVLSSGNASNIFAAMLGTVSVLFFLCLRVFCVVFYVDEYDTTNNNKPQVTIIKI